MAILNIDTDAVRGGANLLRGVGDNFRTEINNLYSAVDDIQPSTPNHVWWGETATKFVNDVNDLKPKFEEIVAKIEEYANWLDNAASNAEIVDSNN